MLTGGPPAWDLPVTVRDDSGRVTDARAATPREIAHLAANGTTGADEASGGNPRSILVHWFAGVCGLRGVVRVAADGWHVGINLTSEPACGDVGMPRGVVLTFADATDPGALTVDLDEMRISENDLQPGALAFLGGGNEWVGGTATSGDAVVVWRLDDEATWWFHSFGIGSVIDVAVPDRDHVYVTVTCEGHDACRSGLYRVDANGPFELLRPGRLFNIGFRGLDGVAIVGSNDTNPAQTALIMTTDGGTTWEPVPTQCPSRLFLVDAVSVGAKAIAELCVGGAGGGSQTKALLISDDAGRHWTVRSTTEREGGLPFTGTVSGFDLRPDGTGWLWGPRAPLYETEDGGQTWGPTSLADGDVRIVAGASLYGAKKGGVLVWDPDRQATLLLETIDGGSSWDEIYAFPQGTSPG